MECVPATRVRRAGRANVKVNAVLRFVECVPGSRDTAGTSAGSPWLPSVGYPDASREIAGGR
ncbi:hypothetical protein TRAPUB_8517 [Trametes pubescens]|uniref:Uncharacterized protein n=1 Tax=Trametes pubescens TaxID=154538 RepID=A0A1M2W518_TRAPU|nr:hypothetical protein TRAPUB_8517 [Trametes pubescens]